MPHHSIGFMWERNSNAVFVHDFLGGSFCSVTQQHETTD